MKRILLLVFSVLMVGSAFAQDDLFGPQPSESKGPAAVRQGWLIGINGWITKGGADLGKRFGYGYAVGPVVEFKTATGWIFGAKFDFLLGNQVTEDSLLCNVVDAQGYMIDGNGSRLKPQYEERGYAVGLEAGKLFNFSPANRNTGLLLLTSAGLIQHKILIYDNQQTIPEIRGNYLKGYDRLTNGMFLEQYAGYMHLSRNGLINFHIGLDMLVGFTQGRRDYLFDVMHPDNQRRIDILYGIRAGFYIPIFKRRSEELVF